MNKSLTLCSTLLMAILWIFSREANAQVLDVEFGGELINLSCRVSSTSVNKEVRLENLRLQTLNQEDRSEITSFSIGIDNCQPSDLDKLIKMTWHSSQLVNIDGHDYVATQGESGVVLGLLTHDEKPIEWNTPMEVGKVIEADCEQELLFGVFARKPQSGLVKEGDFSGWVTFALEYE